MNRTRLCAAAAVGLLAVLGGCQAQPAAAIRELPMDSILSPSPVRPAMAPVRPTRPATRLQPAEDVPREWIPAAHARPWRWIVVHHSASDVGSAAIFDRCHRARGWDELGYHFVITNGRGGADGTVEVGSRWGKQKWGAHCKTPGNDYNDYGIGVCLVGDFSDALPSRAQMASLRRLVMFLTQRYDIPASNVIGHRDAPHTNTECPGDALHRYLHRALRPGWAETLARRE